MNRTLSCLIVAWFFVAISIAPGQTPPAWKAGAASGVITPQQPTWMAGYASRTKPSEGKFQDLNAKALVLEDPAGTRFVLLSLDLIGIPREIRDDLEKRVAALGIKREGLLISCSHTHSGPVVRSRDSFFELPPNEQQRVDQYAAELPAKLVEVIQRAIADLGPARLGYSYARAGFAMNRRLPTPNGFANSPYPDGPVDHQVPVLRVERPDGKLRAVVFGYACHNTTLALFQFSGDYAGYAQQYLEEAHPGTVALFVTGCGADQNPYPRGKLEMAQQHGRTLALAVEAALMPKARAVAGPLRLGLQEIPLEMVPTPREELQKMQRGGAYEKRYATRLLEKYAKGEPVSTTYPYLIQAVRLGDDLLLIALAGEVTVDYSLRLKREIAGPAVWVAGYANDVFGYVPSARVIQEGGYEVTGSLPYYILPGPFAGSIEDRIVAKAKEMAR